MVIGEPIREYEVEPLEAPVPDQVPGEEPAHVEPLTDEEDVPA